MTAARVGECPAELDLGRLAARVCRLVDRADGAGIVIVDSGLLVNVASVGVCADEVGRVAEIEDTYTARLALRTGAPVNCDDVDANPSVERGVRLDPRLRSLLTIPLIGEDRPFGLLVALSSRPAAFTSDIQARAERIAEGVAMVIWRALAAGTFTPR